MKGSAYNRVRSLAEWLCDHRQEDRRITVGCKDCKETKDLLAATVLTAWLPFHDKHNTWVRNPFVKKEGV